MAEIGEGGIGCGGGGRLATFFCWATSGLCGLSQGRAPCLVTCVHSSPIHDREKITQGLLAIGGIGCAGAEGLECAVDRLVPLVPLGCRPRLPARFGLVPD